MKKSKKKITWIERKRKIKKNINLYLMILPILIGFTVFKMIPIGCKIIIGFLDYDIVDGFTGSTFVGFKHYINFFKDPYFFRLIKNTFIICFWNLVFTTCSSIILALLINEISGLRFKRIVQSISYLPNFISTVVVVGMMTTIFSSTGVINSMLLNLGFDSVTFLGNSDWYRFLYVFTEVWKTVGWGSIIYLAAITSVSPELYEAAMIDGANRFQRCKYITFPFIKPTIVILTIMNCGKLLDASTEKTLLMYSPVVYDVADVLDSYVYRRGIGDLEFSYAGAVSMFVAVISLILVLCVNKLADKYAETSLF